ncbi:MAG TPA: PD-(D/E)XK nuclease family protein [Planctomycetota bacterium]|nr:PD-(D/E)XK nuclease family protein [Planctomycetota bacterium]
MNAADRAVSLFGRLLSDFRAVADDVGCGGTAVSAEDLAHLLQRFNGYARTVPTSVDPSSLQALLDGFTRTNASVQEDQTRSHHAQALAHGNLCAGFQRACEEWQRQQEATADDFNILAVLELTGKELRHSMALAWMLCRDIDRLGTHAQGNQGFRFFLREVGLPDWFADTSYRVAREVSGENARVDIEVYARGKFLLHIENKIWSSEGIDQTEREWSDMQRRAEWLEIPKDRRADQVVGLYLSPSGSEPQCVSFRPVRWSQVARAFDRFAEAATPPEVRLFAAHYAKAIRRFVALAGNSTEAGS